MPDARYGEELMAWVMPRGGAAPDARRSRRSAAAGSPPTRSRATAASSTTFPMTVTGKIQKFKMREQAISELGLVEVRTA